MWVSILEDWLFYYSIQSASNFDDLIGISLSHTTMLPFKEVESAAERKRIVPTCFFFWERRQNLINVQCFLAFYIFLTNYKSKKQTFDAPIHRLIAFQTLHPFHPAMHSLWSPLVAAKKWRAMLWIAYFLPLLDWQKFKILPENNQKFVIRIFIDNLRKTKY